MNMTRSSKQTPQNRLVGFFKRFAGDETASVAVEYAMVAAGIGVAVAAAVVLLGQAVSEVFFDKVNDAVKGS